MPNMSAIDDMDHALQAATDAIRSSDALLIGAGAGMGVDSGLPDFRGNEGFWKAYDFVFRNQESLMRGTLTPDEVAKAVGVDSAALKERMGSAEIDAVLQHDISEAKLLDLKATPAIYVEGRHVDSLVVMDARFWERIADWYFERTGVPRPGR